MGSYFDVMAHTYIQLGVEVNSQNFQIPISWSLKADRSSWTGGKFRVGRASNGPVDELTQEIFLKAHISSQNFLSFSFLDSAHRLSLL